MLANLNLLKCLREEVNFAAKIRKGYAFVLWGVKFNKFNTFREYVQFIPL